MVIIVAKGYCLDICFNEGFVYNRNFCAVLLREKIAANSLKVEMETKQSCKVLIDILKLVFLDI